MSLCPDEYPKEQENKYTSKQAQDKHNRPRAQLSDMTGSIGTPLSARPALFIGRRAGIVPVGGGVATRGTALVKEGLRPGEGAARAANRGKVAATGGTAVRAGRDFCMTIITEKAGSGLHQETPETRLKQGREGLFMGIKFRLMRRCCRLRQCWQPRTMRASCRCHSRRNPCP